MPKVMNEDPWEDRFRKDSTPEEFTLFEVLQKKLAAWRAHLYGNVTPIPRPTSVAALHEMRNQAGWQIRLRGKIYECIYACGPVTQKEAVYHMWALDAPVCMRSYAAERSIGRQFCTMERAGAIFRTDRRKDMITGRLAWQYEVTGKVIKDWEEDEVDDADEEVVGMREKISILSQAGVKKDEKISELTRMVAAMDARIQQYRAEYRASQIVIVQLKKEVDYYREREQRKDRYQAHLARHAKAQDAKARKADPNMLLF